MVFWTVTYIVSGGQTGADRAALDWAMAHHIPYGGWCPAGRLAEDGPLDARYELQETPTSSYAQRTEWNVRDSDGTVLFSLSPHLTGGTLLTLRLARKYRRPYLHLYQTERQQNPATRLLAFLQTYNIQRLNVAGPRASTEPAIGAFVQQVLECAYQLTH
ncbi:putative molybdenum carrier protein [Thermosporothrix hazakensis]|uniref:Molybdenum cofactor carrier n=2 Tax=Thermosporothrix TaxID=768650 RepID=A0A455SEP7_9CHLR|nr:putative molybdenum carrier protein [Thermosporothrix hazakensis]PZW27428.1 putative molybdenum carrier protein [Thermosporothrix hazakensis]BBH85980.1 hypothetical protein KTC_07310 [Thermosporothrix sp. COM3]GCE45595.1 hypothetical protein KTH_04640 [Thermosporothrix hazakensis]